MRNLSLSVTISLCILILSYTKRSSIEALFFILINQHTQPLVPISSLQILEMPPERSLSPEHTHQSRARSPVNDTIAANLSKSFTTPQRHTPNSARKRRPLPNLSRTEASPSHGAHMTSIFREASITLQGLRSPPLRHTSNSKRPRVPLSVARSTRFGNANSPSATDQDETEARLPTDSGIESPQRNLISTPEAVTDPAFEHWRLPQVQFSTSKSSSLPSTPMPIRAASSSCHTHVDIWLNGVLASQDETSPSTPGSSDKENVPPSKSPSPSTRPPSYHTNSQVCYPSTDTQSPAQHLRFDHPLTPQGYLNLPPRRKKPRAKHTLSDNLTTLCRSGQDFTIHDDEMAGALAELSPQVERHRKGRGPKRERRASYFDADVLPTAGRKGTKPLGESAQNAQLTKSEPFIGKATDAAFGFPA